MRREIAYPLLALAILLLVAIVAYHFLEGWDWLTSTLYATATVTTIGYNAVSPESFYGKIFTIFFMVGGVATGFYALVQLAQFSRSTFEGRFERIFQSLGGVDSVGYLRSSRLRGSYLRYQKGGSVPIATRRHKRV